MKWMHSPKIIKLLAFFAVLGSIWLVSLFMLPNEEQILKAQIQKNLEYRFHLSKTLEKPLRQSQLPPSVDMRIDGELKPYQVQYTMETKLQEEAEKLLKLYKPDYGSIFMMEAETGRVLAMANFDKNQTEKTNLTLKASYPAASVFKIVTATTAIDRAGLSPGTTITFNGGNYTLYRKNVMSEKINRWSRTLTLRDAFAHSINTAFGRLSLKNFEPTDLNEYAHRFMFNQPIPTDFPVDISLATVPQEKNFEFTEVASGFNRLNRISPVHGAMIAGSIINQGRMVIPYIVDHLVDSSGQVIFSGETLDKGQVMSEASAEKVKELMEQTILSGTSRKSFRSLVRNKKFREVVMGGKTGHLTGDNPKGRVDWFVGYASDEEKKVAVAAITVNVKYWTVKSSYLGQSMFRKYFETILQSRMVRADGPQATSSAH